MKNTFKVFGNLTRAANAASHQRCAVPLVIIALVAVIGFSMAACGGDNDGTNLNGGNGGNGNASFNGTWKNVDDATDIIIISGGTNWTRTVEYHKEGTLRFDKLSSSDKANGWQAEILEDGLIDGRAKIEGGKLHWEYHIAGNDVLIFEKQ